jgi:hypothetical protein
MRYLFILVGLSFLCAGCESVQPIAENTPSIVIKKPQHRPTILGGSVDFPVGVYAPDFKTVEGTYYKAPTMIIWNALGTHRPRRGGLFIPVPISPDQKVIEVTTSSTKNAKNANRKTLVNGDLRQGAWLDQEEDSSLFGAGASSTTRLWRFDEPVPYEIQKP